MCGGGGHRGFLQYLTRRDHPDDDFRIIATAGDQTTVHTHGFNVVFVLHNHIRVRLVYFVNDLSAVQIVSIDACVGCALHILSDRRQLLFVVQLIVLSESLLHVA